MNSPIVSGGGGGSPLGITGKVFDLALTEAQQIASLNRSFGDYSSEKLDDNWVHLIKQMQSSVSTTIVMAKWTENVEATKIILESTANELLKKGEKIQKAAMNQGDPASKPERLRAALTSDPMDVFRTELKAFIETTDELLNAFIASKALQEAIIRQSKQSEKFAVAVQRFVRVSKTCTESLPEAPKVVLVSPREGPNDKMRRRATTLGLSPDSKSGLELESDRLNRSNGDINDSPSKKDRKLRMRAKSDVREEDIAMLSRGNSDLKIESNTASVKKKRKTKKTVSQEDLAVSPVDGTIIQKTKSKEKIDPEKEGGEENDNEALNQLSVKRRRKQKLQNQKSMDPLLSSSYIPLEGSSPLVRSTSGELTSSKPMTKISRSSSAGAFYLYTMNAMLEAAENVKTPPQPKKKKRISKEASSSVNGTKKKLTVRLSEEMILPSTRKIDVKVERQQSPLGSKPPMLENVTVSPFWNASLKKIGNLKDLKDGEDLGLLPSADISEISINPLLSLARDRLMSLSREGSMLHSKSTSREINSSRPSTSVEKQQEGGVLHVSENGVEVLLLEVEGGSIKVLAGFFDKLIEKAVDDSDQDAHYVKTLILTYRQFTTSMNLLEKLISLFNVYAIEDPTEEDLSYFNHLRPIFQQKVLYFILQWVKDQWIDFHCDIILQELLEEFLDEAKGEEHQTVLERIVHMKSQQMSKINFQLKKEEREKQLKVKPRPTTFPMDSSIFVELDPKLVATQLTLVNASFYSSITPSNLHHYLLNTSLRRHSSTAIHLPDNDSYQYPVESFLERETQITMWVALEICSVSKVKTRRIVIRKLIKIAKFCLDCNDYFGAFAVANGLLLPPVRKLKKTWEGIGSVDNKILQQVTVLMEPLNNMENYRKALENAKSPIIPFFPILLRELLVTQEKLETIKENKMINLVKFRKLYEAIIKYTRLAAEPYPFEKVDKISFYVEDRLAHSPSEEVLERMAKELE